MEIEISKPHLPCESPYNSDVTVNASKVFCTLEKARAKACKTVQCPSKMISENYFSNILERRRLQTTHHPLRRGLLLGVMRSLHASLHASLSTFLQPREPLRVPRIVQRVKILAPGEAKVESTKPGVTFVDLNFLSSSELFNV